MGLFLSIIGLMLEIYFELSALPQVILSGCFPAWCFQSKIYTVDESVHVS